MLRSPAVGSAQQELGAAIRYRTEFTDRMRELAILLVAARWDSAFERESHEAIARAVGFSDDELAAIRAMDVSGFADDERHRRERRPGAAGRRPVGRAVGWASAALGVDGVFELTALVGYYSTLALQLRVFRVE